MKRLEKRREKSVNKELQAVEKLENRLERAARKAKIPAWKTELERKIPWKVYEGLQSAFCKGFALVFDKGRAVIEKSYSKEALQSDHAIRDYAVQLKGRRKELKQMHKSAKQSNLRHLAVTAVEGIGLGALGIGMPDIVLFLGTLLGGIYETALNYGFEYESRREQLIILKMMETALRTGEDWLGANEELEELLASGEMEIPEDAFDSQLQRTASVFAMDMLLLKFIQGLPVLGIIGGAANPVYYGRILKYVQVKYRKRYLMKQL